MSKTTPPLKEVNLPSGKKLTVLRNFKGRDVAKATQVVGKETENLTAAIAARVIKIDGQEVLMEQLLDELDGQDYLTIIAEVMGGEEKNA